MGNSIALSDQVKAFRSDLEARRETVFAAAAQHINPAKFIELAARSLIANPDLLECSKASLFTSVAEAANLGLELGGVLGEAYLVPYKSEAKLVPGYRGYKELAYRSDKVQLIEAEVVCDGDHFDYLYGTNAFVDHKPKDDASTDWTHTYAFAKTTMGGTVVKVMSRKKVELHRDKFARGWQKPTSAWQTNPEAMAMKTVLRKLYKFLPLSSEIQRLVQRDEYMDYGVPVNEPRLKSGDDVPHDDLDGQLADAGPPTEEELQRDQEACAVPEKGQLFATSENAGD